MPLGIPHSVFLGWDPLDQDKALAWMREMAKVCPNCHTRPIEWEMNENAYMGDIYHCEGCARLEQESSNTEGRGTGIHVRLLPEAMALARMEAGEGLG